jgi:Mce-associated membrane protein
MAADRTYHALTMSKLVAVAAGALVLCTGAASLTAVAATQVSDREKTASLREQVLAAGRQIAVDFAAYDYRHLDADFKRVASESTGTFKKQFSSSFSGLQDLFTKAQAVSTAEVASAGVVDAGPRQATVVIAIDRTITNTSVPDGQKDSLAVQLTLLHVGDRWLASELKPL